MNQQFFEKVNALCVVCPASWESGDRTARHNANVGGKNQSYHVRGLAMDLIYDSVSELILASKQAIAMNFWGVEMDLTNNHLHIDGRPESQQWRVVRMQHGENTIEKDLIIYLTTREQSVTLPPVNT